MYNVAGRPGAPTASLAERATEHPIRSVLVVNLVIPAQEGVYQLVFYFGVWAGDEGSGHATLLERLGPKPNPNPKPKPNPKPNPNPHQARHAARALLLGVGRLPQR